MEGTLSLILLGQEQVLDVLERGYIQIGHTNHLPIPPYDMKGLLAIVRQRAEAALNPKSWDEELLKPDRYVCSPIWRRSTSD